MKEKKKVEKGYKEEFGDYLRTSEKILCKIIGVEKEFGNWIVLIRPEVIKNWENVWKQSVRDEDKRTLWIPTRMSFLI